MRKSILNKFNKFNNFNNQAGEGVSSVIVGLIGSLLTALVLLLMVVMVTIPKPGKSLGNGDGVGGGKLAKGDTNNLPTDPNTNNLPTNTDTNNLPTKEEYQNSGTAYLVCVNLPGINFPRTPALDRRVAEMWLAVRKDLEQSGIAPLSFSWAFRSGCQQVNVKPSINPNNRTGHNSKALPGRSPHEAGRGLDVRDMTRRKDAGQIVATFNRHGWRWLGVTDPPHFEVLGDRVGEPDHPSWIRKIQESYKQGYPKQGCRGPECGE